MIKKHAYQTETGVYENFACSFATAVYEITSSGKTRSAADEEEGVGYCFTRGPKATFPATVPLIFYIHGWRKNLPTG